MRQKRVLDQRRGQGAATRLCSGALQAERSCDLHETFGQRGAEVPAAPLQRASYPPLGRWVAFAPKENVIRALLDGIRCPAPFQGSVNPPLIVETFVVRPGLPG
jgi:hypothetical protein